MFLVVGFNKRLFFKSVIYNLVSLCFILCGLVSIYNRFYA
ncbi:hypothetical protein PALI_a2574 [Pseudoalteromonas aliena SW19]|uniref:Uncharacterized protein n=1 Tax=Pseudoalteromonas aliena SW19 TaxID=1314866 RepID=A0ABR9E2B2_9GAMM|nr:hypothetical protein [Pseudoalteromonas aliena SW19]